MRNLIVRAACAALVLPAVSLSSKPLATEQFKANAPISIDPAKAYILVRSAGFDLKLLRVSTAAERAAYQQERAEALVKARQKYSRQLKAYEYELALYNEQRSHGNPTTAIAPERPVEPTEASFAYKSIDSDNFVTVWGGRVFDKGGPRVAQLIAVPPGTYRIYGQLLEGQSGAAGFCLCMGTVQFNADAGKITDLGAIHYPFAEAAKDKEKPSWNGMTPGRGGLTQMAVEPAVSSTYVPPALASLPRVSADYRASGKMDNYFGAMVQRMTPLPGVLSYKRDEVIDEKSGNGVGSE